MIAAEQKRFLLQTHAANGDESLGVNEVDTDQENTQLVLLLKRAYRSGDEVEGRPQKRRKL